MWSYVFANKRINQGEIDRLEDKARSIKSEIIDQQVGTDALRADVSRLMLVVAALKRTLIDKGLMTEDEFEKMILDLDLEDGVQDGMVTDTKIRRITCEQCGKLNRNRAYCYFCGQPLHVKDKVDVSRRRCTKCRRLNAARRRKCMYCGEPIKPRSTTKKKAAPKKKRPIRR